MTVTATRFDLHFMSGTESTVDRLTLAFWLCIDGEVVQNIVRVRIPPDEKINHLWKYLANDDSLSHPSLLLLSSNFCLYKVRLCFLIRLRSLIISKFSRAKHLCGTSKAVVVSNH